MSDVRRMQLGQVVDFVISYNERVERSEKVNKKAKNSPPPKRRATQQDIDAFFG